MKRCAPGPFPAETPASDHVRIPIRQAGINHLGATSAYVTGNTDLIQARAGMDPVRRRLLRVVAALAGFARRFFNRAESGQSGQLILNGP